MCIVLVASGRKSVAPYVVAAIGFALPLLPLVPWHLTHPSQFAAQMRAYGLYDPGRGTPLRGLLGLLSFPSVSARAGVYYNYFNPSLLFLSGDGSIVNSTRHAGVFLLPVAIFLPAGIYAILALRRTPIPMLLVAGLAAAPLAGVLVGEVMINRALVMMPFAVLISVFGIEHLLDRSTRRWRLAAIALLVAIPLQFAVFYADYLTGYRVRSSRWFERNIRGGIEAIIARDRQQPVPAVYLSSQIGWIDYYWRFYLIKARREDLLGRTVYFDPKTDDVQAMPWRALMLTNYDASKDAALVDAGRVVPVAVISEPDATPSFTIVERN
jgi:hypothetical protein